ncbi:MAG: glycosyltransferase family 9 protein [Pseudobutyrivibrio sp.]|nr:glycosyltransferase family 9 protein [Pseudobutyrivibrio sp.]
MKKFNSGKTKYLKYVNAFLEKIIHVDKATKPLDWKSAKEILIIDYNAIGDIVMLIPFLNAVRENAPSARITLVCRNLAEDVLSNQGLIDVFITSNRRWFSTRHHVLRDICEELVCLYLARKTSFDIALEPRGDLRDIYFMSLCKSRRKAAFTYTGGAYMLTDPVDPDNSIEHMIDDKIYFLKALGCLVDADNFIPDLHLSKWQEKDNEGFQMAHNLQDKYIIGLQPTASLELKEWEGFPQLIRKIHKAKPEAIFLIFTEKEKSNYYKELLNKMPGASDWCIHVCEELKSYIQRVAICDLVICNDSSAGHIAAAFGIDAHVIFGPVLASFAQPRSRGKVYTYEAENVSCRPCNIRNCAHEKMCLSQINADIVFNNIIKTIDDGKDK